MTTVDLVYFNAGGGHRASALALRSALNETHPSWCVRMVNLFEVLDAGGHFRRVTGSAPEDWYNRRLARGWTFGMGQELRVLQRLIRLSRKPMVRRLRQHWLAGPPDLVVSLIPNFNRPLFESLELAWPGVPYVTLLTDLADLPPRFWIERGQAQHFICGTPKAVAQARAMGHDDRRIHATSGMILRPEFHRPIEVDRAQALPTLGLDPARPTGLVLFGGHGSKAMIGIAKRLADTTQLILVCGHNAALATRLRALPRKAPALVLGYTEDLPRLMRLSDFFIGKPGPGSLSEAVQQGLPVIVEGSRWTMPQERYNIEWVRENGFGIVVGSFRTIDQAVGALLARLDEFRANVRRTENRALHEVPVILAGILAGSPRSAAVPDHAAGALQGARGQVRLCSPAST